MAEGLYAENSFKNLSDAPPRLQRLLFKVQPYDFEIKYIPGKEVALVDALSRVNPQYKMELKGLVSYGYSQEQNKYFLVETSFCQFSNMLILQFYIHIKVYQKMFSL